MENNEKGYITDLSWTVYTFDPPLSCTSRGHSAQSDFKFVVRVFSLGRMHSSAQPLGRLEVVHVRVCDEN